MANLIPSNKNGSIIKADKFFASSKSAKVNNTVSNKKDKFSNENILLTIEKKVIKIDKLLKDSLFLKKKENEKSRIKTEQKSFTEKEKELEKKKPKKEKGVNLPTPPKMGFLDWIKNFITQTFLGFIAVRLIDFLPQLLKIFPVIIKAGDFLINIGGKLLDGLVTFVDWGYKAIDGTRGFIKNLGGEGLAKNFDKFAGAIDNVIGIAILAALTTADIGGGDTSGGGRPRRGFDKTGNRVSRSAQRRYFERFGRNQFIERFGKEGLENLPKSMQRGALQKGARNAFMGIAGKGGAKAILGTVRPLLKRIPIPVIGALIDFGLSWALGEDPGRAAFRAIGAGILGTIGGGLAGALGLAGGPLAIATAALGALAGGTVGDMAGGALYDLFFGGKKGKSNSVKTNKLAGGGKPVSTGNRKYTRRTLKKKKSSRTLSFVPTKIRPGRSTGGEAKVQSVFPNPEKPAWWDPFGIFTKKNKQQNQQPQQKTSKEKTANPQEFLIKSNDVFGRAKGTAGQMISGFATYIIKSLLGDVPNDLDYLNISKGINFFMQGIFEPGTLGFAGGGEVDARQFFEGKDYTKIIAKSVKESGSREVDVIIRNLKNELSLRPVGREEMLQQNQKAPDASDMGEGAGIQVSSDSEDFWLLATAAMFENSNPQGAADVAQVIYNRTQYPAWNASTIRKAILNPNQFQPVRQYGGTAAWAAIKTKQDALRFSKSHGKTQEQLERVAAALLDKNKQNDARRFVGPRDSFRSDSYEAANNHLANETEVKRHGHTFGFEPGGAMIGKFKAGQLSAAQVNANIIGNVNLKAGDGKFIQGNSGRSGGTHFHIGTNKPGDGSGVAAAGFKVIKHFLGKKSIYVGRSGETIPGNATDEQIRGYIARGQAAHYKTELDLQIGGTGAGNKVAFPLALKGMKYSATDGYGVSADIVGTNAFVGHGRYKPDGSLAPQQKLVLSSGAPDYYAFHGMNKLISKDSLLKVHKGEYISVTDADSFRLVGNILTDINSIENKSQLVARAPSIIEKLKSISGYTDYENPYSEPEVVYVKVPVEVPVPIAMGGAGNVFVSGVNSNMLSYDIEQKLSQIG